MTLLLASASPARRRLLELAAIPHRVQVSGVDEEAITDPSPAVLVQKLAQAKAQAVVERLGTGETPAWGVLGCDSVLEFAGEIFGKPADAAEAISRWQQMAGRRGLLHTGHCLLGRQQQLATVTTTVHSLLSRRQRLRTTWPPVSRCNAPVALPWKVGAGWSLRSWRAATAT